MEATHSKGAPYTCSEARGNIMSLSVESSLGAKHHDMQPQDLAAVPWFASLCRVVVSSHQNKPFPKCTWCWHSRIISTRKHHLGCWGLAIQSSPSIPCLLMSSITSLTLFWRRLGSDDVSKLGSRFSSISIACCNLSWSLLAELTLDGMH